jgi:preprotein translocase subunit SecD
MSRNNIVVVTILLLIFAFAIWALVYPLPGREGMQLGLDLQGGAHIVYKADLSSVESGNEAEVMDGVVAVILNRINPLGVTEPNIQKQGEDRIVVELPGLSVTDKQKERLGRTALLEFRERVVDEEGNEEWIPATGTINGEEKVLTSSYFKENTYVTTGDYSGVLLIFEWNEEGSQLSEQITSRLIGQPLGIFEGDEPLLGEDEQPIAPTVRSVITNRGQIEGLSLQEASELSKQLNAGRLPVPLEIIYEQTVSPLLGADFVDLSIKAGLIGIILVMLFMIVYYRLPGALAGIGGFVLSIGMAVDANVLIFERMKEEFRTGRTLGAAIEVGFSRAWTAIRDSNVTTFIVCIILFWVGSSVAAGAPVKGFAWTLGIGVAVSMFTAIVVTRTLLRLFVGSRSARKISLFTAYSGENARHCR